MRTLTLGFETVSGRSNPSKKRLDKKKLRIIAKSMTSQTRKQIITIHMLPNISQSQDNQAMKL